MLTHDPGEAPVGIKLHILDVFRERLRRLRTATESSNRDTQLSWLRIFQK